MTSAKPCPVPQRTLIRGYPIWRCSACRHIVPRDLHQRKNPGHCRGETYCTGKYRKDAYFGPYFEEHALARGMRAQRDIEMARSTDIYHRAKLNQKPKSERGHGKKKVVAVATDWEEEED